MSFLFGTCIAYVNKNKGMSVIGVDKSGALNVNKSAAEVHVNCIEVVVVDDNMLLNVIVSNHLNKTISKIQKSHYCPIRLSSFNTGKDFLASLNKNRFTGSSLIVFTDYHLENKMTGAKILESVKRKDINSVVVVMSDTTNKETSVDTLELGAHSFVPKNSKTPFICSEILLNTLK